MVRSLLRGGLGADRGAAAVDDLVEQGRDLGDVDGEDVTGITLSSTGQDLVLLGLYAWISVCMLGAMLAHRVDRAGAHRTAALLLWIVGFGPLLCAITATAYVKEWRGSELVWDKTEKSGRVNARV